VKRIMAAGFLILFLFQSGGIALTAPPAAPTAANRWNAAHDAPPVFTHVMPHPVKPPDASTARNVPRVLRGGSPGKINQITPAAALVNIQRHLPDPLAMNGNQASPPRTRSAPLSTQRVVSPTPQPATNRTTQSAIRSSSATTQSSVLPMSLSTSPNLTGINDWWLYEERAIPGVGKAMLNVGTGNLIVQADDVDIPGRGIDLAFRRTYNSNSGHDVSNSDGTNPSVFGNGWTSTFDAHLGYDATNNVISVFDIDGARYDYTSNGSGGWNPPPGQHAQLTFDGGCGYYFTKETGTVYYFWEPISTCSGQLPAGYEGRLYTIYGRNSNNYIRFVYSWLNGDASNPENLTQIVASHSDGQALTLTFAQFSGYTELSSITRPDGQTIVYNYDSSGDLTEVDRPGNNAATSIPEVYGWQGNHQMNSVLSPRYVLSYRAHGTAQEGDTVPFFYDSSNRLIDWEDWGVVNFTPSDGTNTVLQSGYASGLQTWYSQSFTYTSSTTMQMADSDGHTTIWTFDGMGRPTQTQEWTGSQWLVTNESWDTNDNLSTFTDYRANTTTFQYDSNGNATMEAFPSVTTSLGTFQPTARYLYDSNNNLQYYCDPNWVHTNGGDYPSGGNPCTGTPSGVLRYVWNHSVTAEPFGQLSDTYTPLGYHHALAYDSYGEPLSVTGDAITQADGTNRTPSQGFTYDAYGDLQTYNTGSGTWHITYDSLNRPTLRTDPDSVSSYISYYNDGSVNTTETAYQHELTQHTGSEIGVVMTYDADGDEITEKHHHAGTVSNFVWSGTPGVTQKFYDGMDRVVEVMEPYDTNADVYTNPWITRTLYDLSQNGTVTFQGQTFSAHGNAYKTMEYLPPGSSPAATTPVGSGLNGFMTRVANTQYQEIRATAFDTLNRPIKKYHIIPTVSGSSYVVTVSGDTLSYDTDSAHLGLLAQQCIYPTSSTSQCQSFTYDNRGSQTAVSFNDTTPGRTMVYDPNGHTISITSATFGTQSYTYDADNHLLTSQDPSSGGVTSPALITHHYYSDGLETTLGVTSSAFNKAALFTYSYRTDGKLQTQAINDVGLAGINNAGITTLATTYTAAGRMTKRTESGAAANATPITATYDSVTGLETGATYPSMTLTGVAYDPEGTYEGDNQVGYGLTIRGEISSVFLSATGQRSTIQYLNGLAVSMEPPQINPMTHQPSYVLQSQEWDDRNAVLLQTSGYCPGDNFDPNTTTFESYDLAGRMNSMGTTGCTNQLHPSPSMGRTFDAENHTIYSMGNNKIIDNRTDWGPNQHPIRIGNLQSNSATYNTVTSFDTVHWNGDQILFTTNKSGQLDDIKVGAIGDILPLDPGYKGLTFYDRGADNSAAGCHNSTGAYSAGMPDPYMVEGPGISIIVSPCQGAGSGTMPKSLVWWNSMPDASGMDQNWAVMPVGSGGGVIALPRTDGFTDGTDTIQGVRGYDSNAGTWTTPDAYAGNVHDPASQKSYMWNGNNPVVYSDPLGYFQWDYGVSTDFMNLFSQLAEEVDNGVEHELSTDSKLSPDERQRLEALHEDLQPNSGNWTVGEGTLGEGTLGQTYFSSDSRGNVTATYSDFDYNQLKSQTKLWQLTTVETEAAKYDEASGRAGSKTYTEVNQMFHSFIGDQLQHALDVLTNLNYNNVLGLKPDLTGYP